MQLNQNLIPALLLAGMMVACGEPAAEVTNESETSETTTTSTEIETYTLDTESSRVFWKGSMLGMHSHEGTLKFESGTLEVANGKVVSGVFTVDMTSINPTDEGYSEENPKEKLIGHLSSNDFFDTANHPTAMLKLSTNGNAELTIRGNTNAETVKDMEAKVTADKLKATGVLTFDRTKYDVSFVHPMQDMVLSNDIELRVAISASKS